MKDTSESAPAPAPAARAAPPELARLSDERLERLTHLYCPIAHEEVLSLLAEVRAGRAEAGKLREERDEAIQRLDGYSAMCAEQEARADAIEASASRLRERSEMVLLFCNEDGSPCDGFRFREEVRALRAALRAETKENDRHE